jgi:DNA-binding winged helix-turn-helix (wHTH) protein/tetratricopeptide (TPR) repeat protein
MQAAVYRFNGFRLVTATRELWKGDLRVALPPRAFACLCHLIEQRDRVVPRDELIATVWHRNNVSDIQLGQLILRTRRAVDDEGSAQHSIRTAVGFGYQWIAPTEVDVGGALSDRTNTVTPTTVGATMIADAPATRVGESFVDTAMRAPHARRLSPRTAWTGSAIVVLIVVVALAWMASAQRRAPAFAATATIAVLPLAIPANSDAAWARLGGMDLIADRLRRNGLAVAPSESVLSALKSRPGADPAAAGTLLRQTLDAGLVIGGSIARDADAWNVHLDAAMMDGPGLSVQARDADLLHALGDAADQLLVALGHAPLADSDVPGVAAIARRVRAALLADDPDSARGLIEQAPAPLPADSELRFLHAQVDARAGRFSAADDSFGELLGTLSPTDNPRLRMRALSARGLARIRVGRIVDARQDFDSALATPGADAWADELGQASNGRGIANVVLHDFDAAAGDFGSARVQMQRNGDVLGVARVDTNLGLLEYERGALAQAQSHLTAAVRRFEPLGAVRELASALSGLQLVQLAQLDDSGALATSARLAEQAQHAGDPVQRRALLIRRAIALLANGYLHDARAILDGIVAAPGNDLHETRDDERVQTLRVELALREGRSADAAREAAALPSDPPPTGDDDLRAWSALLRQRTLGPPAPTGRSAASALAVAAPAARPLRALAEAEELVAAGHVDAADPLFRNALSLAEQNGMPRSILTVAEAYASLLLGQDRIAEAAALIGRTSVWAEGDFDCALLQLRLAHALGDEKPWREALLRARRLANERRIPDGLSAPPTPARAR